MSVAVPYVKRIPVVFHIIHDNGVENIDDSLLTQQIDILNETFRKISGSIGDGNGVDTEIEFCLATIDPNGNATNGITRTQSVCTDDGIAGCENPSDVIFWGTAQRQYLNIWVLRNIVGASGKGGIFAHAMVQYNYVGRNSIFNGRIVTHEVGHWLGLYHTFHGGCGTTDCVSSGDYVCDTPPVASANYGCPSGVNSCSNDNPDLDDRIDNYMDYSTNCSNAFTQGQKDRMHSTVETINKKMYSAANLASTGCEGCSSPPCVPLADFYSDKTILATGDTVWFADNTYNTPTSWTWSFPGGTASSTTTQNPYVVYNSQGTYNVTLTASNAAGNDDTTQTGYITVRNSNWKTIVSVNNTGDIYAFAEYNGEWYTGGAFRKIQNDSINRIAKWNGTSWEQLGVGLGDGGRVDAMVQYNELLFVAGYDFIINGTDTVDLATWDGTNWSKAATFGIFTYSVRELLVYNGELFIGGNFETVDGVPAIDVAKWDGIAWDSVGQSTGQWGSVRPQALCSYNNELIAAGAFSIAGTQVANSVAAWDGTTWYPLGNGMQPEGSGGWAAAVYKNELYVGGGFSQLGDGTSVKSIVKWVWIGFQ